MAWMDKGNAGSTSAATIVRFDDEADWTRHVRLRLTPESLAAVLALLMVVASYYLLLGLKVYGYDEVHYYPDFTFKLSEEGRWINFLLHHLLRHIPLQVHAALYVSLAWLLLFRFARNLSCDRLYAILVASVLFVSPPFVYQSLWPATLLPSLVGLLGLVWLVDKGVSYRVIYPLGGIFLFGCMQNFYFLMPLLFVGQIEQEPFPSRGFLLRIWSHALYWVAGSVVGFLAALLAVYLLIGQVGIVPAPWRRTMPVHDLHDLARNIVYAFGCLKQEIHTLAALMTNRSVVYLLCFVVLAALRIRYWRSELKRAIVLVAVGVSFFAFSVPLAPVIQTRSLVAMSVALIVLMLVPVNSRRVARWLSMILLIWSGWNMTTHAYAFMTQQKEQTEFVLSKIESVLPHDPTSYRAIALFGTMDAKSTDAAIVNSPPEMRAVVLATGVPEFWNCQSSSQVCDRLKMQSDIATRSAPDGIEFVGSYNDVAVIYAAH
jgi:hypothetical protein